MQASKLNCEPAFGHSTFAIPYQAQATCKPQREALEQCIARQKTQKDDERTREAEQSPPLHEGRPQGGCKESSEGGQGDGGARNNAGRNSR